MNTLTNKAGNRPVALVTGGTHGIGLGIALCLAKAGFDLAVCGVIAVIRAPDPSRVAPLVEALAAGGVIGIEVTTSTPGAVKVVEQLARSLGDRICLGAGTVLDPVTAADMVRAGARYIVSPILDETVIAVTRKLGAVSIPAGYTPTEIFRASAAGADVVKIVYHNI